MVAAGVPKVVTTKLSVPARRPGTIARDRLTRMLADAAELPLTVVCAPAGFGKTTALVGWIEQAGQPCAWVSVDPQDNDARRLCAHLLAALERIWPDAASGADSALAGGSDLVETVVPLVADVLAERVDADAGSLAIVLDDCHVVGEPECHRLLAALIDALPPGVRLVVSGRAAPPLRLPRRRAAGTVLEIGPEQLAFRGPEPELLLNDASRLGLAPAQIAAIDERLDGWPAGLALVASSLSATLDRDGFQAALARSRGAIAEYLVEEVLDVTDARVREFLRRTSILGRLCAPLCAAVLDDPAAGELLAEVRRSNLFVTLLDDEWVRYHDVFGDLLQCELRARSPELVPELHRRAAAWFERIGRPEDAIRHASEAGDGRHAARLLHAHWGALFDEGRCTTLRRLLARLPADRGPLGPFCDALDVLCMGLDGVDLRLVAARLDALESQRDAPGVGALVDLARMSPYHGDVGRAVADGWAAWERWPGARARLAARFGVVLWWAGDRDGVRDVVGRRVSAIEGPLLRSGALATLALTAADEGEADRAERYAREAVELAVADGAESALERHWSYVALGEALRLQGRLDAAAEQLALAANLTSRVPGTLFEAFTLTFEAQLAQTAGDRRRAAARAAAARRIVEDFPDTGALGARLATIERTLRRGGGVTRGSQLTPSELRVLELLAGDLTREQIADELHLSTETVRSHVRRLYRRLGVHSRAEAVAVARKRGLLGAVRAR